MTSSLRVVARPFFQRNGKPVNSAVWVSETPYPSDDARHSSRRCLLKLKAVWNPSKAKIMFVRPTIVGGDNDALRCGDPVPHLFDIFGRTLFSLDCSTVRRDLLAHMFDDDDTFDRFVRPVCSQVRILDYSVMGFMAHGNELARADNPRQTNHQVVTLVKKRLRRIQELCGNARVVFGGFSADGSGRIRQWANSVNRSLQRFRTELLDSNILYVDVSSRLTFTPMDEVYGADHLFSPMMSANIFFAMSKLISLEVHRLGIFVNDDVGSHTHSLDYLATAVSSPCPPFLVFCE